MKKYAIFPILSILLITITVPVFKAYADSTTLSINPSDFYVTIDKTFDVDVNITNVVNLTCWELKLYFLNSILNCTNVVEGPFLQTGGSTFFNKTITSDYNSTHGRITAYSTLLGMVDVDGGGVLATITFKALNVGDSTLQLSDTELGDQNIPPQPIPHTVIDGTVRIQNFVLTISTAGDGFVILNNTGPYYHYGEEISLTAVPAIDWSFSVWSGDLTGSTNPATLLITGNMSVIATFTQIQFTLTITITGIGSVNKNPDQTNYTWGTNVTLTANAAPGWTFAGWSGDASGMDNPTVINMTANRALTATFSQNVYSLTTMVVGEGSVSVNNSGPYHYGDALELTGIPSIGWSFSHWSGGLSGSENPGILTITGDVFVTATFIRTIYTLTVSVVGGGSVVLDNPGPYYYGDIVQLTALASVGWSFDHWSGDASGTVSPTTVNMTSNKSVTGVFKQNTYTITISIAGSGVVTPNASSPYHYNDTVVLTALPLTGWVFHYWTGNLTGSINPATMIMTGNFSITAHFVPQPVLQMNPTSKTCRVIGENITVAISLSNALDVKGFDIEIHYNTTLLDYAGVTWNYWPFGLITVNEGNGILDAHVSGPMFNGTQTIMTIKFQSAFHHVWKAALGWTNDLTDTIFIQKANISYPIGPDLKYEKGGLSQITVGPDFSYTFSPIQGDVNNNGTVDLFDLQSSAFYIEAKQGDPNWTNASTHDLDGDLVISVFDLRIIAENYGYTYTS